jgi:hypothetical protein
MAAAHSLTFHQKFYAAPDCRAMFFISIGHFLSLSRGR